MYIIANPITQNSTVAFLIKEYFRPKRTFRHTSVDTTPTIYDIRCIIRRELLVQDFEDKRPRTLVYYIIFKMYIHCTDTFLSARYEIK